jgi:hypothetical protein
MALEIDKSPSKSLGDFAGAKEKRDVTKFHKTLGERVHERATRMMEEVEEHRKNGSYKYKIGDRLKSPKTGNVWQIDMHHVGTKGDARYRAHTGHKDKEGYISTDFRAEPMHKEGWTQLKGPIGSVK